MHENGGPRQSESIDEIAPAVQLAELNEADRKAKLQKILKKNNLLGSKFMQTVSVKIEDEENLQDENYLKNKSSTPKNKKIFFQLKM